MTFDDVVSHDTFYTLDVVYGGVALKASALTSDQRFLFIQWFNDYVQYIPKPVDPDLAEGITDEESLDQAYRSYAHLSPLKYPRVFSLCTIDVGAEVNYSTDSWVINDLALSVSNILDKTMGNKLYMYSSNDVIELRKYVQMYRLKNKFNLHAIPYDYMFDSVDQHAAMLDIDIKVERFAFPCDYLLDDHALERLKESSSLRAMALGEIMLSI